MRLNFTGADIIKLFGLNFDHTVCKLDHSSVAQSFFLLAMKCSSLQKEWSNTGLFGVNFDHSVGKLDHPFNRHFFPCNEMV